MPPNHHATMMPRVTLNRAHLHSFWRCPHHQRLAVGRVATVPCACAVRIGIQLCRHNPSRARGSCAYLDIAAQDLVVQRLVSILQTHSRRGSRLTWENQPEAMGGLGVHVFWAACCWRLKWVKIRRVGLDYGSISTSLV